MFSQRIWCYSFLSSVCGCGVPGSVSSSPFPLWAGGCGDSSGPLFRMSCGSTSSSGSCRVNYPTVSGCGFLTPNQCTIPYVVTKSLLGAELTYRTSLRKSFFLNIRIKIFFGHVKNYKSPALWDAGALRDWPPFCILPPLSHACAVCSLSISVEISSTSQFVVIFSVVCCNRFIKSYIPKCSQFSVE